MSQKEYFKVEQVAEMLYIHPVSVRRLHQQGRLKSEGRAGKRLLFVQKNIDDYLSGNNVRMKERVGSKKATA